MHKYEKHIGDWRRRTGALTLLEKSIYTEFIDTYYLDEMPLTLDLKKLMRSHGIRSSEEKEAANNVLDDFFIKRDDGYHHPHCDEVLETIYKKSRKARIAAIVKWIKRYEMDGDTEKVAAKKLELDAFLCGRIDNASKKHANASKNDAKAMPPSYPITQLPNNPDTQDINTHTAAAIDPDFHLSEDMENSALSFWRYMLGEQNRLDSHVVFDQFKSHYLSTGNKFVDWEARWKMWYMDEKTLRRG